MRLLNLRFFPVLRFPLCMKHSHGSFVQRVPNLHSLPVVLLLAVIQMDNRVIEEEVEEELQATEVISVMERLVLIRTQEESFVIIVMNLAIQNIIVRNFRKKISDHRWQIWQQRILQYLPLRKLFWYLQRILHSFPSIRHL
ncbi:hypothetical protein P3X46_032225 [Hevea brasiliensis]|uniref:Uncharacterized protein n=1 Tax=Hevea brasiliensis TaxID=3981 RepID=A0ABQ9KDT0_HEVBR|nr:hypothetical protein P3X46_032225 [Hevea brasiliensis]